ncbi:MAG: helix-turn-helix domain-containing protein [Bacteroidetes bacterium]|nr:helix-turn-helix domain-containing protein [Bacteroidota bacterium]MBP6720698.1 helix-turn-helix domain-containing protein [Bacteroidia bacterium]MBP8073133.1 helix-turn-helix domain-containing protein [Bacteroidia bacterium]
MTREQNQSVSDERIGGYGRMMVVTLEDLMQFEGRIIAKIESILGKAKSDGAQPLFYKPKQVAALTGLTEHSVRRRLRDGQLAGIQEAGVKGSWLVPRDAVAALVESLKKGA